MGKTGPLIISSQKHFTFVKAQRSFKLSEARMLELKNDKVGFKAVYNSEYCYRSVLKRGKKWANFKPSQFPNESTVKEAKRKDGPELAL